VRFGLTGVDDLVPDPEAIGWVDLALIGVVFDEPELDATAFTGVARTTTQLSDRESLSGGVESVPPHIDTT